MLPESGPSTSEYERKKAELQKTVWAYYRKNKRDLPWRQTTDPYKILVSEIMLQQTQVDRVIPHYDAWIKRWPTIQDLAAASGKEVMQQWSGLGYNRRARNLHACAQHITEKYEGNIIKALERPKELPGIGKYTAQAVQIFALNKNMVTVDTNIRRIFIAHLGVPEGLRDNDLYTHAERCLPKGRSRDWHNALMDYGATLLTARKTGIKPKTTQSAFKGSDRQIRGEIIRQLTKKEQNVATLAQTLGVERERMEAIVEKMKKEKLIYDRCSGHGARVEDDDMLHL